jgi:cell division protein FtsL
VDQSTLLQQVAEGKVNNQHALPQILHIRLKAPNILLLVLIFVVIVNSVLVVAL